MNIEDYEAYKAGAKKWRKRQQKAIKKIKKKASTQPINITCAMLNAVRAAPLGKGNFDITVLDVEGKEIKLRIEI